MRPRRASAAPGRAPSRSRACAGRRSTTNVALLETEKARAQGLPTLDAVASLQAGRGTVASEITGSNTGASIGLQFNHPLYAGGAIQNRIKETIVLEERSRNDLEAARRTVTQSIRQAFYTLGSGVAQAKALEAAEGSSQLALEATLSPAIASASASTSTCSTPRASSTRPGAIWRGHATTCCSTRCGCARRRGA